MNVPTVMPSPRQWIHQQFCSSAATCRFRERSHGFAGPLCKKLDELLDFNDEQVLHAKAHALRVEGVRIRASAKRVPNYLLDARFGAAELIDPYEKQPAHDPVTFPDDYHPGELRPDCPGCVAGREHYHRKSDDSPVRVPDVPRETSSPTNAHDTVLGLLRKEVPPPPQEDWDTHMDEIRRRADALDDVDVPRETSGGTDASA